MDFIYVEHSIEKNFLVESGTNVPRSCYEFKEIHYTLHLPDSNLGF